MKRRVLVVAIATAVAPSLFASITGLVLAPDGAPAANVRVAAFRPLSPYQSLPVAISGELVPLTTTKTDARGTFSIDVGGLGLVDIHVDAEGFAPVDRIVATDEPAGTIALVAARPVEGKVMADGKPVIGAIVLGIGEQGVPIVARTDSSGVYRLPNPAVWAQVIVVEHPDFAIAAHQPSSLDFSLNRGREVRGRVVDSNGRPVPSAKVDINRILFATTAADGTFTIPHVQAEVAVIRARVQNAAAVELLAAGSPSLKLKTAAHVNGTVRDTEKRPLSGITVLLSTGERFGDSTVTDDKGAFAFEGVPPGKHSLDAGGGSVFTAEPAEVNVTERDVAKIDVTAQRQQAIDGFVRNEDGSVASGASIGVMYSVTAGDFARSVTLMTQEVSGADGKFRIRVGDASSKFRIIAVKPGLPPAYSSETAVQATRKPLTLTIPSGMAITGLVLGPDKKPVAGVEVDPVLSGAEQFDMAGAPARAHRAWTATGADGRFEGRLAPGNTPLAFAKKGYVTNRQVLEIRPGMRSIEISLTQGATIRGRVLRSDGEPAAEIPVMIEEAVTGVTSASDGSFSVEGLEPGVHVVRFGRTMMQQQTVRAPADSVRLVLSATRTIHGRVIDAGSNVPIPKFTITYGTRENEWGPPQPFDSENGEFSLDVPESELNISVSADGFVSAKISAAKNPEPLIIGLSHGRTIRGHVVDEQGAALAAVQIDSQKTMAQSPLESGTDGTFEIHGIGFDEDVIIDFRKEGYVTARQKLGAGHDDAAVAITMRRGISVTGRVADAAGSAVANAQVSATSAVFGAEPVTAATDAVGAFHFDGLAPARYDFQVDQSEEGLSGKVRDVDVEKVRQVTIRVDKHATATVTGHVNGIDSTAIVRTVSVTGVEGESKTATIDADGNYRITSAPVGVVEVQARLSDGRRMRSTKSVSVELSPNSEARVDLNVTSQVLLRGHVFRATDPLPNVGINFSGGGSNYFNATAGPEGAYDLNVDPGEYDVSITAAEGQQLPFRQHIVVSNGAEIDFRIDSASQAVIVVDAQSDQPIAGAKITAARRGETHPISEVSSAHDGTASLELPRGEPVTITATAAGFANSSADATGGEAAVMLRLLRAAGAVVRIIDRRDGRTLSGYVIARDAAGRLVASANEADPDGTVTLPLAAGPYQFSASAEEYGSHTVAAEIPSSEIRIPLPRGGKLALRADNGLTGSARLIQPDGEQYVRCWCNGIAEIRIQGRMTLVDRISPGPYTLEVVPTGGKPKSFPVTVIEAQTVTIPID